MARNLKIQSSSERLRSARALIEDIEQSRRDFEREKQSRRRLLQGIHGSMERRRAEQPESLLEDIERQWPRLCADYREYRRRYGYPALTQQQKGRAGP